MERRKLLVADPSVCWSQALVQALEGTFEAQICCDGNQARAMAESFCPDVMVVNLALPGLDGLSLLQKMAEAQSRPALIAVSSYFSAYIESAINRIGVDYAIMKPCDISALAEHVAELAPGETVQMPVPRDEICGHLLALGIKPSRKGFGYLEDLVRLYRRNPCASMTKDLYPEIAKQNSTSSQAVERAVRDAIDRAWRYRDEALWRQYFSTGRNGRLSRPTNRSFIAAVAAWDSREAARA